MAKSIIVYLAKNQYFKVLKTAILLAVFFALISNFLEMHHLVSKSTPILTIIINVLFVIQGVISMMEAIDQITVLISRYAIKISFNPFIKPLKNLILSSKYKENYINQLNQTYLSFQVIRC